MDNKVQLSANDLLNVLSCSGNATAIYTSGNAIIEFANDAMLALWKVDNGIIGKPLGDGVLKPKGRRLKKELRKVLATGETFIEILPIETIVDEHLQVNFYEFEYRAIKDEKGKPYCILHTDVDVTEKTVGKQIAEREP